MVRREATATLLPSSSSSFSPEQLDTEVGGDFDSEEDIGDLSCLMEGENMEDEDEFEDNLNYLLEGQNVEDKNKFEVLLLEKLREEEEAELALLTGLMLALQADKHLSTGPYRQPALTGLEWVQMKLGNKKACYNMFRMNPRMFHRLHDLLVQSYGLRSTTKSTSIEALGMFLWIIGAPQSARQAENRFERSSETMSAMFERVLNSVVKLAKDIIKPVDPHFSTMHPSLDNPRFSPFKDCIGAIDGTRVPCIVQPDKFMHHLSRNGKTSQNVMAVCDFDMRFTFVLAGWPGSVCDMRVFNDAMTRFSTSFPHPPAGKYYLVDSGYPNRLGYLAPYKGTKYWLQEFHDGPGLQGMEEIFNHRHSSLRNVIERAFGVLKKKWRILKEIPCYPTANKQSEIIVACCALHNFIRTSGLRDKHFMRCDIDLNYVPPEACAEDQPPPEIVSDQPGVMNQIRDAIASALANHA